MAGEDDLIGVREAAHRLSVHENTVRNWAKAGILASDHLPSGWHRFRAGDVARLRDDIEAGRLERVRAGRTAITRRELDLLITVARMYLAVYAGQGVPAAPSQARLYQDVADIVTKYEHAQETAT